MQYKRFFAALSCSFLFLLIVFSPTSNASAAQYEVLHHFNNADGAGPMAGLISDAFGNVYGTTWQGGEFGYGVVFKLAPKPDGSWTYSVLYSFRGGTDAGSAEAGVTLDSAGNLYGTTVYGGYPGTEGCPNEVGCGTVFRLTPNPDGTWTESVLYRFHGPEGLAPEGGVLVDSGGNLFGTTYVNYFGGQYDHGTVFKLAPNPDGTWTHTVVLEGNLQFGEIFRSKLNFDSDGNLYGTADGGGKRAGGIVFKLLANQDGSWTPVTLHSFDAYDGQRGYFPDSGVVFDAVGNLFGITVYGGKSGFGTVYRLRPTVDGRWKSRMLHSFGGDPGSYPSGEVVVNRTGTVYGATSQGGDHNCGVVFKLKANADDQWKMSTAHRFHTKDGCNPVGGLLLDSAGNVYGTAAEGGSQGVGVVFKITP